MPLSKEDVNVEEQKARGRQAAIDANATEPKPFGQTSEDNFPYTYWWVVGYNEQVTSQSN